MSARFADAGETVSRQGDFALAEQARSQSDGEHCSTFRCEDNGTSCAAEQMRGLRAVES
jgi:hypothetical protein